MKPTRILNLLAIALLLLIAGYLIASTLVSRGLPAPVSPNTLLITLAAIATVLLLLSIPIWRYRSALKTATTRPKRVDPFYAVRVLLLSKASSIAGAMFVGWHSGVLIYQLTGQVVVPGLILQNGLGAFASAVLVVAALVTEQICRLPQDPTPDPDQAVAK